MCRHGVRRAVVALSAACWAPGFHIIVRGNILWDNSNPPNGTDGNGLIIDDFRNTQHGSTNGTYPNYTLVENNVAYHNGAYGVAVDRNKRSRCGCGSGKPTVEIRGIAF